MQITVTQISHKVLHLSGCDEFVAINRTNFRRVEWCGPTVRDKRKSIFDDLLLVEFLFEARYQGRQESTRLNVGLVALSHFEDDHNV